MYDKSKKHIDIVRGKQDTTIKKTNYFFDAIATLEQERWKY